MSKEVIVESFELDHTIVKAPYVRLIGEETGPKGDVISKTSSIRDLGIALLAAIIRKWSYTFRFGKPPMPSKAAPTVLSG